MEDNTVKIDESKIKEISEKLEKKKKEVSNKLYAVRMSKDDFSIYKKFFENEVEWVGKQALGVMEISKRIKEIEKAGIKDNTIYMKNLEIEASHFFMNSHKGKGKNSAIDHIRIFQNIEEALYLLSPDNKEIKEIETALSAAQQGLELA